MAPGRDGSLWVSVPHPGGSVLALLDKSGRPMTGWPIEIDQSTSCRQLLPVDDGSVRVICDATNAPVFDLTGPEFDRVHAFDAGGRGMAGWPVEVSSGASGRVIGDELMITEGRGLTDVVQTGRVSSEAWLTTISAKGTSHRGTKVPMVETCCSGPVVAVGLDGVAYGVESVGEWGLDAPEASRIVAMDVDGSRVGWPVPIDGIASGPAFGRDGRIVVTVGSFARQTSRVAVFDRVGKASAVSAKLPIKTAEWSEDGDCVAGAPEAPIVAEDGTTFVYSEIEKKILALDPALKVMAGWPHKLAAPLVRVGAPEGRPIDCLPLGVPAVGSDSVLYVLLQARKAAVGGSMHAIGPDGRVFPGWPVELRKPGAEFWSAVVGDDGTTYALAVEPEADGRTSATILAIALDSTLRYRTTVVEP